MDQEKVPKSKNVRSPLDEFLDRLARAVADRLPRIKPVADPACRPVPLPDDAGKSSE